MWQIKRLQVLPGEKDGVSMAGRPELAWLLIFRTQTPPCLSSFHPHAGRASNIWGRPSKSSEALGETQGKTGPRSLAL